MINTYSSNDIEEMREGGKILAEVLQKVLQKVAPGISTSELDKHAEGLIRNAGAEPSFQMEKGYHWATCMCVNDCVVHGVPTEYQLKEGDRLGIDLGVYYQGFHTDASWSVMVNREQDTSEQSKARQKFLAIGEKALDLAIKEAVPGNHIGDISKTIQDTVEGAGYACVKQLVGHGVGRELHEDPEIPCYSRGEIENTPEIKAGMVLAIEVIYNQGRSEVVYENDDGWTIITRDRSISGLFEHTVAVTEKGPQILTLAQS